MPRTPDQVSLGVIGCGRIAQVAHLPAIAKAANVRLAAVCDTSPRIATMVGAQYGVASFTDTEALLRQDLDAVLIAVPDRLHLPLGLKALAAGRHVLLEKPLATTSAEARRLAEAAATLGLSLQVGTMKRHDPGIEYARANLAQIGPITSMVTWYRVMRGSRAAILDTLFPVVVEDDRVRATEEAFKADAASYRLATHGAHVFDLMRHLGGDLAWVSAHTASRGGDHTWHGTAGLAVGGGLASFEITAGVHGEWAEGVDLYGELGHIRIRSPYVFTKLGSSVELYVEADRVARRPHFGDTNPYKRQVEAFGRAILEGTPTNPSPEDGIAAVRVIEAVAESCSLDGRRVVLS
jgi:predicted dehydrogenase